MGGKDHKLQVPGPTGAMTVVLVLIVAAHGAGGVLTVRLHMGPLQVGPVVARAGRCMRSLPASVVKAFTQGIGMRVRG